MAYYEKLASGKHSYVVRLPDGKRRRFTDPLKRAARQKAEDFEAQMRRGEAVHLRDRKVTVTEWHTRWQDTRMVEASTGRKDNSTWRNHLEPKWGRTPVEAVLRSDVQAWVKKQADAGVGVGAIRTAYQLLATLLSDAVDAGLIAASPCRKITLPRGAKPEPRWLTRHEYDRLQLALGARTVIVGGRKAAPDPHAGRWQALVGLGCFAGLRPGELSGLDVGAVDLERGLVRVTQVLTRVPDGSRPDGRQKYRLDIRRYPKSDRSVRSVPFPREVADLLWPLVADRAAGPLFTAPRGGRLLVESNWASTVWHPALEQAGIEPVRPYVMRHTCASWLVQAGVSDRRIMQVLGHADAHLIEVYAHLRHDEHDEIRAAWGEPADAWRPSVAPRALRAVPPPG